MLTAEKTIDTIDTEEMLSYLNIYVADIDWSKHLPFLWKRVKKYHSDENIAREEFKKIVACTIFLTKDDPSVRTSPPENLLYWCHKYRQFGEKDWTAEFIKTKKMDSVIQSQRKELLALGFVSPIMYVPTARQAVNWLWLKAIENDDITPENKQTVISRHERLVHVYGGQVVCNVFKKKRTSLKNHIPNYRTAYFFEKLIYKVYNLDQIKSIKRQDLAATSSGLVKHLGDKL